MPASSARSLRRHHKPAAPAFTRAVPALLAALVARSQTPDAFASAWDAYVCANVDPEDHVPEDPTPLENYNF
jgi:hypothetical protein